MRMEDAWDVDLEDLCPSCKRPAGKCDGTVRFGTTHWRCRAKCLDVLLLTMGVAAQVPCEVRTSYPGYVIGILGGRLQIDSDDWKPQSMCLGDYQAMGRLAEYRDDESALG